MAAGAMPPDDRLDIEAMARHQARAACRRLADTPFENGFMPLYADLYLDSRPYASFAVVPDERALGVLHHITKHLNADAIAITSDTWIAVGLDPETRASATIESRFEVGDPRVSEALAVTVGSLDDGLLSVRIPYARSVMDGLELSEPIISGLGDGDDFRGPISEGLVDALNGVEDEAAASVRRGIMAPTDVEVAMLLFDHEGWGGFDRLDPGWARTRFGVSNVDEANPLSLLLAAAVID
ncbi:MULTISPECIES: hypothetical protein [unclassified Leifsonia]|uniref:hypothetical protein n=1 Tax=unclassified Leifsonia TaxID=2663824 RepID=UPI0006F43DB0|nr:MULTISPECIES: hypothetical protein [unclassified Leifsonia]KQX06860.1 hypothetical protein ASC59_03270 [Leifsonia sp. Root1293]KRA11145.1 hypothetical protein ASD61_03270 [Leifsonia sp. Root60]